MKYAYDLHIHSVLSPCADVLMTPNNIFNMANLKGLNIISVTDHNSLKQLKICNQLSESYDMLFVPGVEITVKENFDVLCYFKSIEQALAFDCIIENYIKVVPYDQELMGYQEITNIYDEVVYEYPNLLSRPLSLSINELINILKDFDHVLIYAHIDKTFRSGINYISSYPLDGVEYRVIPDEHNHKIILKNSDAHQIIDILEKGDNEGLDLEALTIDAFFKYFNK
ncbi:MAG: hypothetical protein K8Q99_05865 [Acholeplasmataceae bacterium]|nr:hypothetical protein [Acholeplasmataceae bacterium]